MNAKLARDTRRIELVETHNIALSLQRLGASPYSSLKWRRALYHAIAMEGCAENMMLERLRIALALP